MPSIPAADAATLAALVRHHDPADLRAHAAALRDRLTELDAQHRDRTQSLRDDLAKVTALLARPQPRGTIDLDRVLRSIADDRQHRQAETIADEVADDFRKIL